MLAAASAEDFTLDTCKYKVEPIGCFQDDVSNRAMSTQIINERDATSNVFNDRYIDWNNYDTYLQGFICRCAEKSFKLGHKMIGIQFYGECYSGKEAHVGHNKFGKSVQCKNGKYGFCGAKDNVCTGTDSTNFVYRIAPTACDISYEPVGCYGDKNQAPRPLPAYISNERDYNANNWNGHLIDWKNWDTYAPLMICRCAKKAKADGYTTFGVQFYGECWSGSEDKIQPKKDGEATTCVAEKYEDCPYNSYHCAGKEFTNRVYKLN
eukprot:gene18103-19912_t